MRPLSPTDTASGALAGVSSNNGGNGSSSSVGSDSQRDMPPPPRTVPMVYRGLPDTTASSSSSGRSSSGSAAIAQLPAAAPAAATSSSGGGGGHRAAAAPGRPMFRRSMMVAGFEEEEEGEQGLPLRSYRYSWAEESYSERRRTLDTWTFVLTLRTRLWLLDQGWSYIGGMTKEARQGRRHCRGGEQGRCAVGQRRRRLDCCRQSWPRAAPPRPGRRPRPSAAGGWPSGSESRCCSWGPPSSVSPPAAAPVRAAAHGPWRSCCGRAHLPAPRRR